LDKNKLEIDIHDDDIVLINIGKNLKYFRTLFGLTQEQVAEKASISLNFYQQIENVNDKSPSVKTLFKICTALNIPFDYLVKDCGNELFNKYANIRILEEMDKLSGEQFNVFTDALRLLYGVLLDTKSALKKTEND